MAQLPPEKWSKLSEYQKHALSILSEAGSPISPSEPKAYRTACHDLWKFGFADRTIMNERVCYQITFLGIRAAKEVMVNDQ